MDNEKRAHDLAILYMQLEIKEGKLSATALKTAKGLQTSINTFMTALLSSLRTCNRRVLMDL